MDVKIKKGKIEDEAAEAIVLSHYEGEKSLSEETAAVDRALGGRIRELIAGGEFTGKRNQSLMLYLKGEIPAKRVLLVGLGKKKEFSAEKIRQAMGTAGRPIREAGLKAFSTPLHGRGQNKITTAESAQAIVEGSLLGLYQFTAYRTEKRDEIKEVQQITLVDRSDGKIAEVAAGSRSGQILAEVVNYVRDLCNHPSNVVTPSRLAEEARTIAKEFGLTCRVIEKAEAESLGMGAFLGVARGSMEPPKFIILEYTGGKKKDAPVVIVGKSITFDSGGISIKPAEKMEQMKTDMSGGAAVLGTMKALAQMKLPVSVVGILPATENMPSGTAVKPGDVVTAMSGKTIEVINTDAEGRMILADALAFATRYKPSAIVDLATLTGACVVALGNHATGVMGTNPKLIERLKRAGEDCGERVWELPLWDEYHEQIKSDVADMKNIGGRGAGAITAAVFLRKFVGDYPWAHLDIAGTAWNDEARPYAPKGATGVGVRLLIQWLTEMSRGRA
ncbi:MAG: leucyl aminopeptidase [Nitrospirae bacterium]|nr:leucyl aminopeptidase [Nitrospirota bacterium]